MSLQAAVRADQGGVTQSLRAHQMGQGHRQVVPELAVLGAHHPPTPAGSETDRLVGWRRWYIDQMPLWLDGNCLVLERKASLWG